MLWVHGDEGTTHTPTPTPHTQSLTDSDREVTLAPDAEVEQDEAVEVLLEERAGRGARLDEELHGHQHVHVDQLRGNLVQVHNKGWINL